MDLNQRKLNKSEWESIETPLSEYEVEILKLIINGYHNVNIKYNKTKSLFSYLKIEYSTLLEDYLYKKFFSKKINDMIKQFNITFIDLSINNNISIKKSDSIRLQKNTIETIEVLDIYENILLFNIENLLKNKKKNNNKWQYYYYTLHKLIRNNITQINRHILYIINTIITNYEPEISMEYIIENAVEILEKNNNILKYDDMTLYEHQKEIFTISKQPNSKLILYIAPTGTGKTLTPIGLSENKKIIFVCAARHVGLALAKSAISVNKKIAFAFGCSSAGDIRLHYFAAKEYVKNTRSGGIYKVDNSIGDKVEIIISDIQSYIPAMLYMLTFNEKKDIITYWDEPTITMDYENHELHDIIKKNWNENLIPNMILSSATLPKLHELPDTITDFKNKFNDSKIYNIVSHDCKKSIPILNKKGYVVLPHYLDEDYNNILNIVEHCSNYLTLLRYFDLNEIVKFIIFVNKNNYILPKYIINRYFTSLDDITLINIKLYYLTILKHIKSGTWGSLYTSLREMRTKIFLTNDNINSKGEYIKKINSVGPGINTTSKYLDNNLTTGNLLTRTLSEYNVNYDNTDQFGIYITTKDSYTLTDGPTIYLANNVEKIARFCIQQANIPEKVMNEINEKIDFNNKINEKIAKLEKELEDVIEGLTTNNTESDKKLNRLVNDNSSNVKIFKIKSELNILQGLIKNISLNDTFVPNSLAHLNKWTNNMDNQHAYTSNISENIIHKLMTINDIENSWKILLLMGIGVFTNHKSIYYTEIMKQLAEEQKLYLIIASSDYIYGTNYQFCHGYLSKDLNLTQEKIIQAMGRIGRNNIQQKYTIRFRDDEHIKKLFTTEENKNEVINMNKLFNN